MLAWLKHRPDKILHCLADSPDAGILFPRSPEEFEPLQGKCWRIQEKPAFIEHRDARLARLSTERDPTAFAISMLMAVSSFSRTLVLRH